MESVSDSQWFVGLRQRLGHEVWTGEAAQIPASYVRQQKSDRRDAGHILKLLIKGRFPRSWTSTTEMPDHQQLLIHRHRVVQVRMRVKNKLQRLALSQGLQRNRELWTTEGRARLEVLPLERWTARRRHDVLLMVASLEGQIKLLNQAVTDVAEAYPSARLLMAQPGVNPVTTVAFVLTIGDMRFSRSKQISGYLGLIPREHSSGGKQRLGSTSKQQNRLLRTLLVEAPQSIYALIQDSAESITTAVTRSTGLWPKWLRRASSRYGSLGCSAHRGRTPRFSHQEQPDWYRDRPSQTIHLNRHSRTQRRLGVRIEKSWPKRMAESIVGGKSSTRMIQRCPAKSFGFQTLGSAGLLKAARLRSVP